MRADSRRRPAGRLLRGVAAGGICLAALICVETAWAQPRPAAPGRTPLAASQPASGEMPLLSTGGARPDPRVLTFPATTSRTASDPEIDQAVSDAGRLLAAGDADAAVRRLHDAALIANPDRRAELYVRAARALASRRRWEEALAEGYAGIAASPRSGWTYLEVAKILAQGGRTAAAVEMADEAARRDANVRFAALDLIAEIRRERPPASPSPEPGSPIGPGGTAAAGIAASLAVLAGWAWLAGRRRAGQEGKTRIVAAAGTASAGTGEGAAAAAPSGRVLGPGDFIGPYRVDRAVATSLHSTLYRADDLRLQRQVAIKQANPMGMQSEAALLRFQKEVQSLIALSTYHDGVIKVYDYLPPGTLVTEWVEGENLDELVGELPVDRIIQIGIDLCDILAFAHSMGIVHRDIKPSNVMVSSQTHRVKLLDFGIAKNAGLGISQVTTDSDVPIGTFTYMAPEQFASPNQAHGASDIYSLGLALFRVITGNLPATPWLGPRTFTLVPPDAFSSIDEFAPAIQIFLSGLGDLVPDLDWVADLDRVVGKAFREHSGDRYRSAAEFKSELERVRSVLAASVRL